jgi:hypothetical protein
LLIFISEKWVFPDTTYLNNHRERLDYDRCKSEGIPIGSGGIESANKYISHARLKRSGAWWLVENGNGMLRLRCALYNGTFDQVFDLYRKKKLGMLVTNWECSTAYPDLRNTIEQPWDWGVSYKIQYNNMIIKVYVVS